MVVRRRHIRGRLHDAGGRTPERLGACMWKGAMGMPNTDGTLRRVGLAVAGTAALLAGCTSGTGSGVDTAALSSPTPDGSGVQPSRTGFIPADARRPAGIPQVRARWTSCADVLPAAAALVSPYRIPLYDPSFKAVTVIMCTDPGAGGSSGDTRREQRSNNMGPVLAALQLPDVPPLDPNGVCTADAEIALELALFDAEGRWIRPGQPADVVCSKRRPEIWQALEQAGVTQAPTMRDTPRPR